MSPHQHPPTDRFVCRPDRRTCVPRRSSRPSRYRSGPAGTQSEPSRRRWLGGGGVPTAGRLQPPATPSPGHRRSTGTAAPPPAETRSPIGRVRTGDCLVRGDRMSTHRAWARAASITTRPRTLVSTASDRTVRSGCASGPHSNGPARASATARRPLVTLSLARPGHALGHRPDMQSGDTFRWHDSEDHDAGTVAP